ncbi:MAG: sigma-70 family RNA polymerase sigma factor, partial [Chloroflexota bacterium]|nr:sigma-70 family RNA polymerase sigma factor [Chloroflexota bacterium]
VPEEEAKLVQRAQGRNAEAFGQLYETHFDRVYRYLYLRVGRVEEAEDLTEQVFLRALESIGSFRWTGAPFASWLFRIAHNLLVDHWRRQKGNEYLDPAREIASREPGPAYIAEIRVRIAEVRVALGQLTEAQRQVIGLRFSAGLSLAEAAKIMSRTEGAIKALQHSALAALRRQLKE